jgi:putative nucleotidyltransferase with HDIG domain
MAARTPFLPRVEDARRLAETLLDQLPDRLRHTAAVARNARRIESAVEDEDRELLVATAWLHDIGYSAPLRDTGFHPLDGARFLDREGWPIRLCALVAHHSGARFVAPWHRLEVQLNAFACEESAVADALTYADQTAGPHGQPLPIRHRIADMLRRHGPDSVQARAHLFRGPYLIAAAERTERRLRRT